jgi:hypothetical protein
MKELYSKLIQARFTRGNCLQTLPVILSESFIRWAKGEVKVGVFEVYPTFRYAATFAHHAGGRTHRELRWKGNLRRLVFDGEHIFD